MSEEIIQELEKLLIEKGVPSGQIARQTSQLARNVESLNKLTLIAIIERYSAVVSSSRIKTQPLGGIFSELKEELPDLIQAQISFLRFRSFCRWTMISSLVFGICGIYLCFIGYLPIGLGGPLIILFMMLSIVFSTKLLQLRKLPYGV